MNTQYEKMNEIEKLSFLAKLSTMYYDLGMTQSEIAEKLAITRFKISKYLQEARDKNVVEISINYPHERMFEIEQQLMEKFNLKKAIVLNNNFLPGDEISHSLGKLGAEYLENIINENTIMGILWGKSISCAIKQLKPKQKLPITVLQVRGAAAKDNPLIDTPDLIRTVANIYNGKYKYLYAPLYIDNDYARKSLSQEPVINDTLFLANKSNLVLTGIGTTDAVFASSLWSKYLMHDFKPKNAVGCIYGHVFDISGKLIDSPVNEKVVGIDLTTLLNVEERIGIASGKFKSEAILGALRGKFINVLITDEDTASKIINLSEN
ncbi:sugar-binding transcriptional regulator [Clostridium tarantellae]|uniref:Sugar-binding transcriptional regulator n=1 Tax=Clostridium tarantellae TaxID=39493 RepID=A0A6I1MK99_9CLOT|nr:sugar-binding transcriptional regulator [Clostridium tarantellae]MPQ43815.1 sugar-binding transcriptional regulator [Clostridium tarantellae]